MQIPLIVRAPGIAGGQRRSQLVETIDLYPTLCELAGVPTPEHLQGTSLAEVLSDSTAPWKSAAVGRFQAGDTIRTDDFRYTEYTDKRGQTTAQMLYNHDADPGENRNVVAANQETSAGLRKQLHQQMGTKSLKQPAAK